MRLRFPCGTVVDLIASCTGWQGSRDFCEELISTAKLGSAKAFGVLVRTPCEHDIVSGFGYVFIDRVETIKTGTRLFDIQPFFAFPGI